MKHLPGEKRNESMILLVLSICVAGLVCFSQIRGSRIMILGSLFLFLLLLLRACMTERAFYLLLFFLPWSQIMKLDQGSTSVYTIALLITCVYFLIKNHLAMERYQVILTAVLVMTTLIAKAVQGNSIANSYLCFLLMLLLFPCVLQCRAERLSFWEMTLFFALGIISAALSAQQFADNPNISQYITVQSYLNITRLSGYYGDPNFYSAQITACLAGVMILLAQEKKLARRLILGVIALVLVYCGLLSASKSFILVLAVLFVVWIPMLLSRRNIKRGIQVLLGVVCAVLVILSSNAFQSLIDIMDARFSYNATISDITTGRTELWLSYLNEFHVNAPLTLLGQGFTDVVLDGWASHNTLIQGVYQFGLIGFPILIAWMFFMLKKSLPVTENIRLHKGGIVLFCIGVALPWMALDILFFDEFFLLPAYALVGAVWASKNSLR